MSDSNNYDIVGKYFDMVQQEIKKLISKDPEIKSEQVDEFNAEIFNQPDQIKAEIRTYIDNAYQSNLDIKKVAKAIYDKFKVQVKNNVFNNTDKQDVPNPLLGERRHIKTFEQWTTDVSGDYEVNYGDEPKFSEIVEKTINFINDNFDKIAKIEVYPNSKKIVFKKGLFHYDYIELDETIKYENGTPNGMMNYPPGGSKRAKEIIRRINAVSESVNQPELSGKHAFMIFLQIISNHDYNFINNEHFTDLYKYYLFFSTETIKDNDEFVNIFKYKHSLSMAYDTLLKIKSNRLAFFFGINNNLLLRYGFVDLTTKRSYVIGEFNVSNGFFVSIAKYKCVRIINKVIQNIDVKKLSTIMKIKEDLADFLKSIVKSKIEIEDNLVIKYIDRNKLKDEYLQMNRLYRLLDKWVSKKSWRNKVEYNVDDTVDPIKIIIIVK